MWSKWPQHFGPDHLQPHKPAQYFINSSCWENSGGVKNAKFDSKDSNLDWKWYEFAARNIVQADSENIFRWNFIFSSWSFEGKRKSIDKRDSDNWAHVDFTESKGDWSQHITARIDHRTVFFKTDWTEPQAEAFRKAFEDSKEGVKTSERLCDIKDFILLLRYEQWGGKTSVESICEGERERGIEIFVWGTKKEN